MQFKSIAVPLVLLTLSCACQTPSAPTRWGWYLTGSGSAIIDIPSDIRTIDIEFAVMSGLSCAPFKVADIRGIRYEKRTCPGDRGTIPLILDFGNTIEITAVREAQWGVFETGGR